MSLSSEEQNVKRLLEAQGFTVTSIPEDPFRETCDFFVADEESIYLIEVKTREDDPAYRIELEKRGVAENRQPLGRTNRLSAIIGKGVGQIMTHDQAGESSRLIWFPIYNVSDEQLTFKQIRSTVYGIKDIVIPAENDQTIAIECYYFTYSDFYRYTELDALVIEMEQSLILLVNNYSHTVNKFCNTKLYRLFKERRAAVEPFEGEKEGNWFIADCDIERSHPHEILEYVKKKYNLTVAYDLDFKKYSVSTMVSRPSDNNTGTETQ